MIHGKYDVVPSPENKGLTIRSRMDAAVIDKLPAVRREKEIADINAANAQATAKYVARFEDANARDILTTTANGLPVVGPSSSDGYSSTALAHNAAMAILDAKLAEIDAKLAQLAAAK
jgi:hypothetical protein